MQIIKKIDIYSHNGKGIRSISTLESVSIKKKLVYSVLILLDRPLLFKIILYYIYYILQNTGMYPVCMQLGFGWSMM